MRKFDIDFEKWWTWEVEADGKTHHFAVILGFDSFKDLTDSMKFGVLADFFDSVGITVEIVSHHFETQESKFNWRIKANGKWNYDFIHYSRQEARKAAIEKAIEIYESKSLEG